MSRVAPCMRPRTRQNPPRRSTAAAPGLKDRGPVTVGGMGSARGRSWGLTVGLVLGATLSAISADARAEAGHGASSRASPLRAFVSIAPHKFLVERVGGRHVQVTVLLTPGQSPATFEPTPKQLAQLADAQVYFRAGMPFEDRLVHKIHATIQHLNIMDLREGIDLRPGMEPHRHDSAETPSLRDAHDRDDRGHAHQHDAGREASDRRGVEQRSRELDPHVWMSPRFAGMQARTICDELCRLDSSHAARFRANLDLLLDDIRRLDQRIAAALAPFRGREFFVFHPAYGYFAETYGLRQVAVESGGKEPTGKQLASIIRRAKEADVRLIFVQPQFSTRSAETLAREIDGAILPLDPLAENYLENLEFVAQSIERALGGISENGSP